MCDQQVKNILQKLQLDKRRSIYLTAFGGLLIIAGITLTSIGLSNEVSEFEINYTNIRNCNFKNSTCPEYLKIYNLGSCKCHMNFYLPKDLKAPVNIYYELESFDPSNISESRDNGQLSGALSLTPSESCGDYRYAEGLKPIAPCGALADAYFNDTFVFSSSNGKYVYKMTPGILADADKIGYHNPPGNLTEAFANFSKPINWFDKAWTKFITVENGFESEKFIGWMHTDWKRKPYARIQEDLLKGTYLLNVYYYYPPSRYTGERKIILSSSSKNTNCLSIGIIFLIIGYIVFQCGVIAFLYIKRQKQESVNISPAETPLNR